MTQTALQQLIQWMEKSSEVIPFDQESCYNKAVELLEVEKQQIIDARINGDEEYSLVGDKRREYAEQYYNETFKK